MAKIKETDTTIKATKIESKCPIHCNIDDTDETIKAVVIKENVDATTTRKGIIRIANDDEAIEGLSENTAITPHTLKLVTHFVFTQGIASNIWEIEHNLNKEPSVTVVDTANEEQIPDKKVYNSQNKVTLYFLSEFAGRVLLN